jgi:organic hydroperoxide reductase OsmC/OhrA
VIDAEAFPTEYPLAATAITAAVGAVGYAVPTALFGRAVEPVPVLAFAVAFAACYMGAVYVARRLGLT